MQPTRVDTISVSNTAWTLRDHALMKGQLLCLYGDTSCQPSYLIHQMPESIGCMRLNPTTSLQFYAQGVSSYPSRSIISCNDNKAYTSNHKSTESSIHMHRKGVGFTRQLGSWATQLSWKSNQYKQPQTTSHPPSSPP